MKKHYDLDIILVASGMEFGGDTIPSGKSLGGSETCAIQCAEALAKLGHHVSLFCNTEKPHEFNKVFYQPIGWVHHSQGSFPKGFIDYCRSTPSDVVIVQRMPAFFGFGFESKVNFLWQHDLATKTGPSFFHPQLWNIDKILVLSEFMKRQYQAVHAGPDHLYFVTRNGIDLDLIDSVPNQERDRFRLTYTSRPERGLDILLTRVFPEILKREPRAKLYLSRYADTTLLPLYQELDGVIKSFGDRIEFLGNLGKQALYENYKKARLCLYPSQFEDTSNLTINEVGACGALFIGPWRAACPETADGTHILLRDDGSPGRPEDKPEPGFKGVSNDFCRAVAEKAVELIHDDAQWERLTRQARKRAEEWTWRPVAERWAGLAHELIEKRSADPIRLTKHFLVHSDIVGAQKLAEQHHEDTRVKKSVDAYIDRYVPWMHLPEGEQRRQAINDFYEQRSGGNNANWMTGFYAEQEPRMQALLMWMKPKVDAGEITTVLDFGCAHGGYARVISNMFPTVKVVGVDNSASLIRCAEQMRQGQMPDGSPACRYPDNLLFVVGDDDTSLHELQRPIWNEDARFDCIVCMEVLEHLPNSENVARKLERHCKPDGWMVFTVPNGRRERDELITKNVPPVHVRAFDLHDIRDMFGARRDYSVHVFSDLKELAWDRSFSGWFMATYRKDNKQVGDVDWQRHLVLQGPRETVSVCMITNNSDSTLRRCLKSVQSFADQLVVVDNGPSTDKTIETALEFGAIVKAGTSPFYCYRHLTIHPREQIQPGVCEMAGFETPRNESIETTWCDWNYWIDSDEFVTDPTTIFKYLRPNIYYGYGVQQHHLSIDAGKLKVDLPVRLMRNHMGIKFFGLVHEHGELGPNRGMGSDCAAMSDLNISHDGYINEGIRRGRFDRNLNLLKCDRLKYPDRTLGKYLYDVRDNLHQGRYIIERNQGRLTDEARQHLEGVIKAYKEFFLTGKEGAPVLTDEGLDYYSEALTHLGLGFEFVLALDVKRQGAQPGEFKRFRALDRDEGLKIIAAKMAQLTSRFEGEYVA